MRRRHKIQGPVGTALQVRRAWETFWKVRIPEDKTYSQLAVELINVLGREKALALIASQSNDPDAPEPEVRDA